MIHGLWVFLVLLLEISTIPWLVWAPYRVPTNTFECFFFPPPHTNQSSTEYLRRSLWNSLEFSLDAVLSVLVVCPENSSYVSLSGISALSPHFRESARLCLVFFPCTMSWKVSQGHKMGQLQGTFLDCPLLPDIQYFKTTVPYNLSGSSLHESVW